MPSSEKTIKVKPVPVQAHGYEPWMREKMIAVGARGGHVPAVCKAIGIRSKETFYRWMADSEDMKAAYQEYRLESQAFYEDLLLRGAMGTIPGFNFNSVAMTMNNKFKEEYSRSPSGSNTEINIGSINSIDGKQLESRIKQLQKKLQHDEGSDSEGTS